MEVTFSPKDLTKGKAIYEQVFIRFFKNATTIC
jgi:hypothetical protein